MKLQKLNVHHNGLNLGLAALRQDGDCGHILCIHGLGCTKASFAGIGNIGALRGYGCVCFDLPGFGDSERPGGFSYRMEDHAEVCRQVVDEAGFEHVHLVCHSMGGVIGLILAEMIPHRVAGFVNVEGNLVKDDCRPMQIECEKFVRGFSADLERIRDTLPEPIAQTVYDWQSQSDPYGYYHSQVSLGEWSGSGRLLEMFVGLKARKAFMYGENNAGNPVLGMLRDHVEMIGVADSGHFMMLDNSDLFYTQLAGFITAE